MNHGIPALLLLVAVLLACDGACADERASPPVEEYEPLTVPQYKLKNVVDWTVDDVESWLNRTIGYTEYVDIVREHLVDGPTLLFLSARDLEQGFHVTNPLHLAKLLAHIQILKRKCICPSTQSSEFWGYFAEHSKSVWILGATLATWSRVGLVYVYLFDEDTFVGLLGPQKSNEDEFFATSLQAQQPVSTFSVVLFLIGMLLWPRLLISYHALRYWNQNMILMTLITLYCLIGQLQEYLCWLKVFLEVKNRTAAVKKVLLSTVWWTDVAPVVAWITSYFLPHILQQLAVWAFGVYTILLLFSVVMFEYQTIMKPNQHNTPSNG